MTGAGFRIVARLLTLSTIGGTTAVNSSDWPPLPSKGFIVGRAAQQDDLTKGDAVFVSMVNNVVVGKPLAIQFLSTPDCVRRMKRSSLCKLKKRAESEYWVSAGLMAKKPS
jgi:hypothetical protein